jgi:hypothetical protein
LLPLIFAVAIALPSTPYGPSDDVAWGQMLKHRCPENHIQQWMPDGQKVDLLSDFIDRLPPQARTRAKQFTFAGQVCAAEHAGLSCEAIVGIHGMRRLGLLRQFTSFICVQAACSDAAVCERPASLRRGGQSR